MSVRSTLGNLAFNVQDLISSVLTSAKTKISNIVGKATTSLTHVWDGGFTGMSEGGIAELKITLTKYCREVQDLIDSFDQTGDITSALKGDVQTAAYDFIDAIKKLLQAYRSGELSERE